MIKKTAILLVLVVFALSMWVCAQCDNMNGYDIPVDIIINGSFLKTPAPSYISEGVVYVPVRALCEALGAQVTWDENTGIALAQKDDVQLYFSCIEENKVRMAQIHYGSLCVPVREVTDAFGYTVSWDNRFYNVSISAPDVQIPPEYVNTEAFSNADVLLLAKLIYAEAGACGFNEQIGVGGVVMNRDRSPLYPDTISGVIYDRRWAIQFTPAYNGLLNREPSGVAIIAAKCVMHGVNIVRNCTGFGYAAHTNSWMAQNMNWYCTYGVIGFYEPR